MARPFHALLAVPPPLRARRVAGSLVLIALSGAILMVLVPWIQNIQGAGRVIAYAPLERQQVIEAPISGQVQKWHVQEGDRVAADALIVELADNDPMLVQRLEAERKALLAKLEGYEGRAAALENRIESVTLAQREKVSSSIAKMEALREKVRAEEQKLEAATAASRTARLNLERVRSLFSEGLVSRRDLELAELKGQETSTKMQSAEASLSAAKGDLAAARATVEEIRSSARAKVDEARAKTLSARADSASTRVSLQKIDAQLSRQSMQRVRAPRAGSIFRILAFEGGEQVKPGDALATLVPDTTQRAVELWVDGNDAALISSGRPVRLQFEGWPAVQFSGWPSVAVGTFGGRVAFVDALDDGGGDFRIVVIPDEADEPWPPSPYLRQGVRANGWIILERVRLGFELWRRFNGFPPVLNQPPGVPKKSHS